MLEVLEVDVPANVDEVPVVDPGPAHAVFVDAKAERPDEVQRGRRRGAKTRDVPGVGGNFGLHEDDVKGHGKRPGSQAGRRSLRHGGLPTRFGTAPGRESLGT
jgi:hypothetical protein